MLLLQHSRPTPATITTVLVCCYYYYYSLEMPFSVIATGYFMLLCVACPTDATYSFAMTSNIDTVDALKRRYINVLLHY